MSETNSNISSPSKKNMNNNNKESKLSSSNLNNSIVPNQQSIKMEVLQFKDDVLRELKILKKSFSEKYEANVALISEKLSGYDNQILSLNERITELSGKINTDNNAKTDISSLLEFKNKTRDHLLTIEIKVNNIDKEMRNNIFRIDNILSDSVIYPGIIGKACKFKTFHNMVDHILSQISQTITYREKNTLDLNSYKKKLESLVQNLQSSKNGIVEQNNHLINKKMEEIEEKFKNLMSLYDERLAGTRAENAEYIKNMQETVNKFKNELRDFENLKGRIFEEIKAEGSLLRVENEKTQNIFLGYKKEFNLLKDRFTQLSEFIKDVRFRINLGQEVKRREYYQISNKLDFSKKQKIDNNGNINITNIDENETSELPYFGEENTQNNKDNNEEHKEIINNRKSSLFNEDNKYKLKNTSYSSNFTKRRKDRNYTVNSGKFKNDLNNKNEIKNNNSNSIKKKVIEEINQQNQKENKNKDIINLNKKGKNVENKKLNAHNKRNDIESKIINKQKRGSLTIRSIIGDLDENLKNTKELNKIEENNNEENNNKSNNVENKENIEKNNESNKEENIENSNESLNEEEKTERDEVKKEEEEKEENEDKQIKKEKKFKEEKGVKEEKIIKDDKRIKEEIELKDNIIKEKNLETNIDIKKNNDNNNFKNNNNLPKNIKLNQNINSNSINFKKIVNNIYDDNKIKNNDNLVIKDDKNNIKKEYLEFNEDNNDICNQVSQSKINQKKVFNGIINKKENEFQKINIIPKNILSSINNKSTTNNINIIESRKNSKIYSPTNQRHNYSRVQSALSNKLPNLNNNTNYMNKKQQTIRPSSSVNNIFLNKNLDMNRIMDLYNKNTSSNSKAIIQNQIFEEDKKLFVQNNNKKKNKNNNVINSEIYFTPNNGFKTHKIKTFINPNIQALQHGVQQLYDNNTNYLDKNNIYQNYKKFIKIENKKASLNNTDNSLNKKRNIYERNNDARELQDMIYNLQGYIKGYNTNFMSLNELNEEKKRISKNSSYYKFKEIANENWKNNMDIRRNNKRNLVEIGFNNYY